MEHIKYGKHMHKVCLITELLQCIHFLMDESFVRFVKAGTEISQVLLKISSLCFKDEQKSYGST